MLIQMIAITEFSSKFDLLKTFMKKLIFISLLFISLHSTAQSADELSVRKVLNEQTYAWNSGDIDAFMKGYWQNDSLMFVGKSGVTYGWKNTLNNYKKNY